MTPQECDEKWPELKVARMAAKFGVWEEVLRIYYRVHLRDNTCVGTELFADKRYDEWVTHNQGLRLEIRKSEEALARKHNKKEER